MLKPFFCVIPAKEENIYALSGDSDRDTSQSDGIESDNEEESDKKNVPRFVVKRVEDAQQITAIAAERVDGKHLINPVVINAKSEATEKNSTTSSSETQSVTEVTKPIVVAKKCDASTSFTEREHPNDNETVINVASTSVGTDAPTNSSNVTNETKQTKETMSTGTSPLPQDMSTQVNVSFKRKKTIFNRLLVDIRCGGTGRT